jgi:hypothetical protein
MNSSNLRYVEVNGEVKAPASLTETHPPVPTEKKSVWAPKEVWIFGKERVCWSCWEYLYIFGCPDSKEF